MNVAISSPVILTGESSLALQLSSNSCSVVDHEKNQIWEEKGFSHSYHGGVTEYGFFFF